MKSFLLINKWQKMRTNGIAVISPRDFKTENKCARCWLLHGFTNVHSRMSVAEEWHAELCWYQDIYNREFMWQCRISRHSENKDETKASATTPTTTPFLIDIHMLCCSHKFLISSFSFLSFLFALLPCQIWILDIFLEYFTREIWKDIFFAPTNFSRRMK